MTFLWFSKKEIFVG